MGFQKIGFPATLGRWFIFFFFAFAAGSTPIKNAFSLAQKQFAGETDPGWQATKIWIESAECAKRTGAWLAICDGDRLLPIAARASADDPGYAMVLGLEARFRRQSVTLVDVARLNVWINTVGVMAVGALLFAAGARIAAFIFLALGLNLAVSWIGLAPHPGLLGVALMASVLPGVVLLAAQQRLSRSAHGVFLVIGLLLLGGASMLREPTGIIGFLITIAAAGWVGYRARELRRRLACVVLVLAAATAWQTPKLVLAVRDSMYPVQRTDMSQTHGISHNLYIGLGVVDNKFGIHWNDADGDAAVRSVAPDVRYTSKEYFRILWSLYLDRVIEDPVEVARIYIVKSWMVVANHLPKWAPPLWLSLAAMLLLVVRGRRSHLWSRLRYECAMPLVAIGAAFVAMLALQGILANPSAGYAFPVGGFVILFLSIGLECFVRFQFVQDLDAGAGKDNLSALPGAAA